MQINLDQESTRLFLGPHEAMIMQSLWESDYGAQTAKEIHQYVCEHYGDRALTTTRTVIDRMVAHGTLKRFGKPGDIYHDTPGYRFCPVIPSEREFLDSRIHPIIDCLIEMGYL